MACQRSDETPQVFADRCKILARRIVPYVTDPTVHKIYNQMAERILLASFTAGLTGNPGRQVRFSSPKTLENELQITITVTQAEVQERRNEAFYLDSAAPEVTPAGRIREPAHSRSNTGSADSLSSASKWTAAPGFKQVCTRNASAATAKQCFEFGGNGHFARDCVNRSLLAEPKYSFQKKWK
jgi:hypothetical protein